MSEKIVTRTVTFNLPTNIDEFFQAYANLLKYKSVEDYLKEEIQYLFNAESIEGRFADVYFVKNVLVEVAKRYNLKQDSIAKPT